MLKFGSKSDVTVVHRATIRLFDDNEIIYCDFQPQEKGRYILEYVCKQLNILEMDYFGLRYVDKERERHWLDLAKTAIKQVKDMHEILLCFRVKFYPPDPLRLKEEITRYQVYQQLKRDLLYGRLCCSPGEAALLVACIVQSELGDYDPEIHEGNYISEHKLLKTQTSTIEEKAMELHQAQLKGFTPEQAENYFLRIASQLDTYAVDPHPVKDPDKGTQLHLGINHCGILTFQDSRKIQHFRWPEVQKINFEGKMFIVHVTINEKKHLVGFKCPTATNCRHVWRCAIEQMLFFTLPRASDAPVVSGGSIFSWGYKFKYTGRTEREVLEEAGPLRKEEPPIQRCQTTCLRRKASSVPATPSTPSQDLVEIRYSSLPRSCHSAGLDGTGMLEGGAGVPLSSPYCPDNTLPLLETVSEDQEIHARRNNAVDENDTHASATHTSTTTITTTTTTITTSNTITTNRAKAKLKFPKSTLNRPQPLYSQKIVIGSEELAGHDVEHVVRQRINALINERCDPTVVRSTALIIKSSKAPASANGRIPLRSVHSARDAGKTRVEVSEIDGGVGRGPTPTKTANGCANLAAGPPGLSNGFDRSGRREAAVGQYEGEANDYYFRDSFDHSSSESQLLDASGKPHSRSVTPVPKMQKLQNSKLCLQQQHHHHHHQHHHQGVRRAASGKLHVGVRIFMSVIVLVITVVFIVIVLVFETDTTLFNDLRKMPEMVALRSQYYIPIKEFLRTKLGLF
ncbi:PREDICTED: FERM domain-containing protein 5 isoform X2 [Wasmannia auropunctata]|uniref:FERM domain-containing protein 5 isoform X2 n=1 Tax=Wasmannia auropunctata TaxID=64793 RepID=UPI0005EEACB6|nr:PREDICTED: FERM domain-containing protein 5 isoform X2 [Wasmannia auropunctata]